MEAPNKRFSKFIPSINKINKKSEQRGALNFLALISVVRINQSNEVISIELDIIIY